MPEKQYIESIKKQFGAKADAVLSLYPGDSEEAAAKSQGEISRDQTFGIQGFTWANMQSDKGKAPVYVYSFDRKLPAYTSVTDFGAFHTGEVVYAYDNLSTVDRPWLKEDHDLALSMSTYWTNFAKTGNPNNKSLIQWPRYQVAEKLIIHFDQKIHVNKLATEQKLSLLTSLN